MQKKEFSVDIGGKKMTALFSDLVERANGSVIVTSGNTSVLATAVMSPNKREGIDFFPLIVDYEERFYAAGEILGSRFIRREGRPSDEAILGGRMVDRTIRPLFDSHIRNEVQIVITILAIGEDDPDVLAINAASLALGTSPIPWSGPVSAVRVGKHRDSNDFSINPPYTVRENENAVLDALMCGKEDVINMIEVGAREVPEDVVGDAMDRALQEIKVLQKFQKEIIEKIGKEKMVIVRPETPKEVIDLFEDAVRGRLEDSIFGSSGFTHVDLEKEWENLCKEKLPKIGSSIVADYFEDVVNTILHGEAIEHKRRADGRKLDEIRELYVEAGGVSPILHGTGIFYRGGTHVLSILTLGGPKDAQFIDSMETRQREKHFMHHYNFPPFSTGETGRMGGINRRAVGHGALAEKALYAVIPPKEKFPYTIRIVSEALASNGSTSMGSVCGSTLALMDAGVPIKAPVAGIAMGLMLEEQKANGKNQKELKYKILTDIQGPEDHHGDMDFKVAGTRGGITALQLDVKVEGVPTSILKEALGGAQKARVLILDKIESVIKEPRKELSHAAPRVIERKIDINKIGLVIGAGGQTIRSIVEKTGADVDIEDDGTMYITGKNGSAQKADAMVEEIVHEYRAGERFEGTVTRLLDFGAFVKIAPHAEGLVHVSEFAPVRINRPSDAVKEGDRVPVVVKEIDEKGRINLSIKSADPDFFTGKIKPSNGFENRSSDRGRRRF